MPAPHPIIHINGYPGTGKLTVAQILTSHVVSTNLKLIHNHLLINPADAVLHRTQPGYQSLRRALRAAILTSLATEPATFDTTYLFTDFQTSNEQGASVCAGYAQAAKHRDCY
jgi:thymidylate kinase